MFTHVVQDNQRLGPAALGVADGMEDAVAGNGGNQLLNEESQQDGAHGGEEEVVDEEERLELESRAVDHQLATAKDDGVVDDDEDGSRLESRHGRLEGHEAEVIGRVAQEGGPCLVEDGPEVNAKGAVDRWQRELLVKGSGCSRHDDG